MKFSRPLTAILFLIFLGSSVIFILFRRQTDESSFRSSIDNQRLEAEPRDPLEIEVMRQKPHPGSKITIEETLSPGINYNRYITSYLSDSLKIYGLLTIPTTPKPEKGYPAIDFLHGHLDGNSYTPTERYAAYQDGFAANGYVTFKPDLRGHGQSQGELSASNFSPDYVTDALNAKASLQQMPEVNPEKIGMWGHSMGGGITLKSMVVVKDIKAGVIWAGVVGDYEDLLERYRRRIPWLRAGTMPSSSISTMAALLEKYGSPSANSPFWQSVDPYSYLSDISGPIQLHHGTADDSVPIEFSRHLRDALQKEGKTVEEYEYVGSDHNITQGFNLAMQRSIAFFDKHLK
ncbi:MAG: Dipeptidylaminopeptidase/acylaminoacyl-peptidase [Microgenomates group bacterium GW2011_GWA1_48_10]|nr:MAG: Dipeptidylaminopeptidase/acylaminoacyl-peptidase [Microgenomates group bacterium GW2011_GWA1_48_10]